MENLPLIFLLSVVFTSIYLMFFYIKKLKFNFLQKLVSKNFINKHVYCSLIIDDICNYILKLKKRKYIEALQFLSKGNITGFYNQLCDKSIKSKIDICNQKTSKDTSKDFVYLLALAKLYIKNNDYDKALNILQNINIKNLSIKQKAYIKYILSLISIYEGDLMLASNDLNTSLKFFKKNNMTIEEAETYFMLGTIYRVSGIYDTSEFMLRASLDLYNRIGSDKGEAETLGTIGLLMSAQNRFEEARDYLKKALKKSSKNKTLKEFILSQQAMLEMVVGNYKIATSLANKTLKKNTNNIAKANSYDVLSRVALNEKKYILSAKYASKSFELFFKNKNYSAAFESLYVKAFALSKAKKTIESEKTLRYLIDIEKNYKHCFHIAGAYTLLGLVLLNTNQQDRAKAMFNQALSKELCNNRKVGVAIDYANLALIEKQLGNNDEARTNLQKALGLVDEQEEEIINKIKTILD